MRFKFGTYSLKIKTYNSSELGIEKEHPNLDFTIRQKIFHFWFIPLFPVDKFWKVKRSDTGEEVLETTPKMRNAIDLKVLKQKSPIWSYSGSIVIAIPLLLLMSYFLYGVVDNAIDNVNKNVAKNNRIDNKEELVKAPEINDLYTFKTLDVDIVTDMNGHFVKYKPSYFSSPTKVDYVVNYISKDSIGFEFIKSRNYSNHTFGLKQEFRLSKNELILATKNYQDLKIQKYPNEVGAKTKDIVGVFEIVRGEEMDVN